MSNEQDLGAIWRRFRDEYTAVSRRNPDSVEYWGVRHRKDWIELMLPRIRDYSKLRANSVIVPDPAYHGSPYHGTQVFDPTIGQGLGVWFTSEFMVAIDYAVNRCRYLDSATPAIYEAKLKPQNTAIFR